MVPILQIYVLKFQKGHVTYPKILIPSLQTTAHVSYKRYKIFRSKQFTVDIIF